MESNQKIKHYPLSSPQREIWFDQILHPETPLYNVVGYMQINGPIDPALFESAVNLLVKRHDTLRIQLVPGNEEMPMQAFLEDLPVTVPFYDFSGENHPHQSAFSWMQEQIAQPFDLYEKQLFYFALLKIDENCFLWFKKYHHLIIDGWGTSLITQSLAEIYTQLLKGQKVASEAPSYIEFVKNDRAYIESERYEVHRQYWIEKYQILPEPLFAPRYLDQFVNQIPPSGCHVMSLERPFYNRLQALAESCKVSTFHLILGSLYVYLARTSQTEELVVGLPVLNRPNATFKKTAGLFVGVSVARFAFGTDLSFESLLLSISRELKQNYRYQRLPISELNREIGLHQVGRKQLFDIIVSYEKHDYDAYFDSYPIKAKALLHGYEQTPLMISAREFNDNEDVDIDFVYNLAYFDVDEIERIQARFMLILEHVLNHVDESIRSIPLLTETEQEQLQVWNKTGTDYHKNLTIVDLFEALVEKTPGNTAVVFEDQQLSYQELNEKANKLSHYLLSLKTDTDNSHLITDNCLVGICVERSLEMVIGLLGILKAGYAYVPLDPGYPLPRLQYMLEDSEVPVLLSQSHLMERFPISKAKVVCLDSEWENIADYSGENPLRQSRPEDLSYVIYTSGSTGTPKGVMVEHSALINLLFCMQQRIVLTSTDKLLAVTTLSFDIAALELYLPLIAGSQTIIISRETANNGEMLVQKLVEGHITVMQATPSTWKLLLQSGWSQLTPLTILCGGEALPRQLGHALLKNSQQLWNVYGPTETTIWSSIHGVTQSPEKPELVGQPIANTQIYILDANNDLTPQGLPGELCITGRGLSRGYLNLSELTAEKFIEIEIFGKCQRFYKTGDLARWLPDGNLEFLGRLDNQVKLRGFRIELSEIEFSLMEHETVKEAVVLLYNQEDNASIVAYITLAMQIDEVVGTLRTWLKARLPEYMLPTSFTVLDKLPLTPNGKINRKALPAPDFSTYKEQQSPRTETEHLLCNLWSQVLGMEVTSINSHFFEIGGHSLLASQLASRIRESFGIEMPLRVIFDHAFLKDQAEWLNKQQRGLELPPITPLAKSDHMVLSFAQQRLWFLAQLEGDSVTYNMPAALHLAGPLDETALQDALTALVRRHDSLRASFPVVDGEAVVQLNEVYNPLSLTDLSGLLETERQAQVMEWIANNTNTPFDLSTGPLLRVHLLKLNQHEQILLLNMHHIISDGWSIGILIRELGTLYESFLQGRSPSLPPLPIQYVDFAHWQRQWLNRDVLNAQLVYWKRQLGGTIPMLPFPTDYPRTSVRNCQGAQHTLVLSSDLTDSLKTLSLQNNVTLFMTLLAAFKMLLYRHTGIDDIIIGTPIALRNRVETEGIIGLFLNTLALRTDLSGNPSFRELLRRIREVTLGAYAHQEIPFERLVEELQPERNLSQHPIFDILFNFINTPSTALEFPGLSLNAIDMPLDAKFLMTLYVEERNGLLNLQLVYQRELFSESRIVFFLNQYLYLLEQIVTGIDTPISGFSLVTPDSKSLLPDPHVVLSKPQYDTVPSLIFSWAKCAPMHKAVSQNHRTWSYRELTDCALAIARVLLNHGIQRGDVVAISGPRCFGLITSMIGTWLGGGVLLTLDKNLPSQRRQLMLKEAEAKYFLYLCEKPYEMVKIGQSITFISIGPTTGYPFELAQGNISLPKLTPEDAAYIFFYIWYYRDS